MVSRHRAQFTWSLLAVAFLSATLIFDRGAALAANSMTVVDPSGRDPAMVQDADGNPVIAYVDGSNGGLRVVHCEQQSCASSRFEFSEPDSRFDVLSPAIALDSAGNPVIAYDSFNGFLTVLHCNDPDCASNDEFPVYPQSTLFDGFSPARGDLRVAVDGLFPVIAWENVRDGDGDVYFMHCSTADCSGFQTVQLLEPGACFGHSPALALSANNNPVLAFNSCNGTFNFWRCDDPSCSGTDFKTQIPLGAGAAGIDLVLDGSGNPVFAFEQALALAILRCNDQQCAGNDETLNTPDDAGQNGFKPSLRLVANKPVVAYLRLDTSADVVKLLRCNDVACAPGGDTVTAPDSAPSVGRVTLG
ncbi:MAG: hypothetical protein WEB00_04610 [Dehalococcoidia bacterium]